MKTELQHIIGYNLRRIRTERKITREELEEKAGIRVPFYANLESGNRMMSIPTLRKLSDVLCVTADSLLYEEHLKNIKMLLQSKPKEIVSLAEQIIHLITTELPLTSTDSKDEEAEMTNGCGI